MKMKTMMTLQPGLSMIRTMDGRDKTSSNPMKRIGRMSFVLITPDSRIISSRGMISLDGIITVDSAC